MHRVRYQHVLLNLVFVFLTFGEEGSEVEFLKVISSENKQSLVQIVSNGERDSSNRDPLVLIGGKEMCGDKFNFMELVAMHDSRCMAGSEESSVIYSISSSGDVYTSGSLKVESDLQCSSNFILDGSLIMRKSSVMASDIISVESIGSVSLLEITEDGTKSSNMVQLDSTPYDGQLLAVMNNDSDPLSGVFGDLPPMTNVPFIFSQRDGWLPMISMVPLSNQSEGTHKDGSFFSMFGLSNSKNEEAEGSSETNTLRIKNIDAKKFVGASIDFDGSVIYNAALSDCTIDGVDHIGVKSITINDGKSRKRRNGEILFMDENGVLVSEPKLRWSQVTEDLKVSSLSGFKRSGLEVGSDIDLKWNTIRNAHIEPGTVLQGLHFEKGTIENTVLKNVTTEDLTLEKVAIGKLYLPTKKPDFKHTSPLVVSASGEVQEFSSMRLTENSLEISTATKFSNSVDLTKNELKNAVIKSSSIIGDNVIDVGSIKVNHLQVSDQIGNSLVMFDGKGNVMSSSIKISNRGALEYCEIDGNLQFLSNNSVKGRISNAFIEGGEIHNLEQMDVKGDVKIGGSLAIGSSSFIEGSLNVNGQVFGSGPYIDASDRKIKQNVETLRANQLGMLQMLQGVTYTLKEEYSNDQNMQYGFIAQEVEKHFPYLVNEDPETGLKGVQYARFVPVLVEAIKELVEKVEYQHELIEKLTNNLDHSEKLYASH